MLDRRACFCQPPGVGHALDLALAAVLDQPETMKTREQLRVLHLASPAGWPEASQPPAPTDPHVSLSTHTARVVQLYQGSAQCLQCTNSSGSLVRTPRNHVRARGPLRSSRLYFHLAHRTRWRSMRRQSGTTALG
jgi:hypothetical protein